MKINTYLLIFLTFTLTSELTSAQDTHYAAETKTAASVFEGQYKVGTTTCTVTPVKMAYEIKWAKGNGSMIFFFYETTSDGKIIFISNEIGKGNDKFIFNNDDYKEGNFIRADGKAFIVEKLSP